LLTDPSNKNVKEDALLTLKKENGGNVLLLSIASPKAKNNKHLLVAACWESEINFSKYLSFFILLALDTDYLVSLEAITVIENMAGPFEKETVKEAIKKVKAEQKNVTTEKIVLLNDLIATLESYLEEESK
jgi:thermostable 8-oxoguanine DNA glycosylase